VLRSILTWFTWLWAIVFVPIETYLSFLRTPFPLSGYAVNVLGLGITVWGTFSLRRDRPYAEGVLAAGWAWTTAVFWRGTNLRYWYAAEVGDLSFGPIELWLGPIFTAMAAAALLGSLVLLVGDRPSGG
jgi:hypothetical protein